MSGNQYVDVGAAGTIALQLADQLGGFFRGSDRECGREQADA